YWAAPWRRSDRRWSRRIRFSRWRASSGSRTSPLSRPVSDARSLPGKHPARDLGGADQAAEIALPAAGERAVVIHGAAVIGDHLPTRGSAFQGGILRLSVASLMDAAHGLTCL